MLRQLLSQGKMGIEGIVPPPASALTSLTAPVPSAITVRPHVATQPQVTAVRPVMVGLIFTLLLDYILFILPSLGESVNCNHVK
jgi:hypothetical protein